MEYAEYFFIFPPGAQDTNPIRQQSARIAENNLFFIPLAYAKKGEELTFSSYVSSLSSQYYNLDEDGLMIVENYDANTPGIYTVHYYAFDTLGNEGHTVLTVVVEE